MRHCQRLPISYLLVVLIPALVVPFDYALPILKHNRRGPLIRPNQASSSMLVLESRLDPMTSKNRPSRFVVLLVAALSALLYSDKPAAGTGIPVPDNVQAKNSSIDALELRTC